MEINTCRAERVSSLTWLVSLSPSGTSTSMVICSALSIGTRISVRPIEGKVIETIMSEDESVCCIRVTVNVLC